MSVGDECLLFYGAGLARQDHQQSNLQAHNGSKWLKPARNIFTFVCLMWFLAISSISVSGKWPVNG